MVDLHRRGLASAAARNAEVANLAVYLAILFCLVVSEAVLAPTHGAGADNAWHFRWASDIVAGRPIFWLCVDGNRIFPDLIFSIVAVLLPSGHLYETWWVYFHGIEALSLGLSLVLLSSALYSEPCERLVFLAVSCAAFVFVTAELSYWSRWIMSPGYTGASLCAVIAVAALFLTSFGAHRPNFVHLAGSVCLCICLVTSYRYLAISIMLPMMLTAVLVDQGRRQRVTLLLTVLVATGAAFVALRFLNSSNFCRLVAPGAHPTLGDLETVGWWMGRLPKEVHELAHATNRGQITFGLAVLGLGALHGFRLWFCGPDEHSVLGLRRHAFALLTANSAILAATFVAIVVDDQGSWRYRYLVIPFCLTVVSVCACTNTWVEFDLKRRAKLVAVSLSALFLVVTFYERITNTNNPIYEKRFRDDLDRLSKLLTEHDGSGKHNGLGGYWLANEVAVRDENVWVAPITNDASYLGYNDNAWDICAKEFSFILVSWVPNTDSRQPNVDDIIRRLGPPSSVQSMEELGRFKQVQILFYEPNRIDKAIVQPAIAGFTAEFPNFRCP